MIYPSYNVTGVKTVADILMATSLCDYIFVNHNNLREVRDFYINGYRQEAFLGKDERFPTIDIAEFRKVYMEFYDNMIKYFDNLQVGDTVVVEERRLNRDDYPYVFADEMAEHAGEEMFITDIGVHHPDGCRFYNGCNKAFALANNSMLPYFTWHSSMLQMAEVAPIKKINITPLPINPIIL